MRILITIIFFCFAITASCQPPVSKGVGITPGKGGKIGKGRALVVGISEYRHIPGLNYADRDAKEFAAFLEKNEEWNVQKDDIELLTNEKAKAGNILSSLEWLSNESKEGDKLIFYFSGHGDVETREDVNQGYLLAHDSPKNNYITGAIGVDYLRKLFTELLNRGVKVYILTDACRSGHLAGGSSGPSQTASSFSKQWKNEVKVLSSQPDELSYEGEEWGEGRGVFSFYLMKGMNGYADGNKDSIITLSELEQYVGQQVAGATDNKQQPVFEGASKFSALIARADASEMQRYAKWTGGRDVSMVVLKEKSGSIDTTADAGYEALLKRLEEMGTNPIKRITLNSKMVYELSAYLLNDLQEVVNQTLEGKTLVDDSGYERAIARVELLLKLNSNNPPSYLPHIYNVRRYLIINKNCLYGEGLSQVQMTNYNAMLDSAMKDEPGAAYLLNTRGVLYMTDGKYDSAITYFNLAMKSSPTWLMPAYYTGYAYKMMGNTKEAINYFEKILSLDSAYRKFECAQCFYMTLGELYSSLKNYSKAEENYLKSLLINEFSTDALSDLIDVYSEQKETAKRDAVLKRLEAISTSNYDRMIMLGLKMEYKLLTKQEAQAAIDSVNTENFSDAAMGAYYYAQAIYRANYTKFYAGKLYRIALEYDTLNFTYFDLAAESMITNGYFKEAEELLDIYSKNFEVSKKLRVKYYYAILYAYTNREEQALELFKELINSGYMDCDALKVIKPMKKNAVVKEWLKGCK